MSATCSGRGGGDAGGEHRVRRVRRASRGLPVGTGAERPGRWRLGALWGLDAQGAPGRQPER